MDPIGASDSWEWHGYENSWVEIDGHQMQSVSGGAHWGGGIWISALDHACVGQLILNNGSWNGRQIISQEWMNACRTPCKLNESYGYLWWLNTNHTLFPSAPASSVFAIGVGANVIWIESENDMVVVARWLQKEAVDGFIAKVLKAIGASAT